MSRKLKASDGRDHVYAFLGSPMARRQDEEMLVEPDYSKNKVPEDVFVEVASALLSNTKEAPWVLLFEDHRSDDDLIAVHLPFWVLRWDMWLHGVMAEDIYWYQAGGDSDLFRPKVHEDGCQLNLEAFFFDRIHWVSEIISGDNLGFNRARWTVNS